MKNLPGLTGVVRCLATALCLLSLARPSEAQLAGKAAVPLGGVELGGPILGMDSAYDPLNHVHLVVSAYQNAWGWFVNGNGNIVAGPFVIKQGGGGSFAPRVKYSPHVNGGQGGFLMTYAEEGPKNQNILHARIVSYPGIVGPETTISEGTAYPWIIGGAAAVSYSPVSQVFLVAWMTMGPGLPLMARTVGLTGAAASAQFQLSTYVGLYPGVSWNPTTDRFGVSFRDEGTAGYSTFAIVSPSGTVDAAQHFEPVVGQQGATDVDYNLDTGRYVMTWFAQPSGGAWEARSAEMDTSANVIASGLLYSKSAGIGFSSLSVAFNPVSRTFLATTLETVGNLDPVLGFELNRNGVRTAMSYVVQGVLARNIRVSTNTELPEWNVAFNHNTQTALNAVVTTTTTGGGPAGAYGAAPTAPTTPTAPSPAPSSACPTAQPAPDWVCVNGGWLPPGMVSPSAPAAPPTTPTAPTSSASCPSVQPAPDWVCVSGNWLPPGLVPAGSAPTTPPATTTPTPSTPSTCPTVKPAADWVCVSGNWLPPGLAPSAPAPTTPTAPSGGCTTVKPAPDWVCIGTNWLPPGLACPTVQPGPDWTCRNGDWLPPGLAFTRSPLDAVTALPGITPERRAVIVAMRRDLDRGIVARRT